MSLKTLVKDGEKALPSSIVSNSNEVSQCTYDIVASITHNRIPDHRTATFKRHRSVVRINDFAYSIDIPDQQNNNVIFLGKENQTADLGYDYMVAVVNKRTRVTDFLPVKLVNFDRVYSNDPNVLLGIKPPPKVDYGADNASAKESWAEKRRALTAEFGSAVKLKMQESANRRQIKEETLKSMMDNSALFSPAVKTEKDEKPISLLMKATSAVLPKPNNDTNDPRSVYSFDLFLSDDEINLLKETSQSFLSRPRKELLDLGFPPTVFQLVKDFSINEKRGVFMLLLATMVACYKIVGKPSKRSINETEWFSLPYPSAFTMKIRELFFSGEFSSRGGRKGAMNINSAEKDKLLSYTLCLILMLDEQMCIAITPWAKELKCPEGKFSKIATALGCNITTATPAEGVRLGTVHIAKLVGPPSAKKAWKTSRRR